MGAHVALQTEAGGPPLPWPPNQSDNPPKTQMASDKTCESSFWQKSHWHVPFFGEFTLCVPFTRSALHCIRRRRGGAPAHRSEAGDLCHAWVRAVTAWQHGKTNEETTHANSRISWTVGITVGLTHDKCTSWNFTFNWTVNSTTDIFRHHKLECA